MNNEETTDGCDTTLLQRGRSEIVSGDEKVQMKKELGLLEGVAIILGIIFGSGNI